MTMSATDYLSRGHDWGERVHAQERQRMLAAMYEPNATYDGMLARRAEEGEAFWTQLPTTTHLAIGHYLEQKTAYTAERKEGAAS